MQNTNNAIYFLLGVQFDMFKAKTNEKINEIANAIVKNETEMDVSMALDIASRLLTIKCFNDPIAGDWLDDKLFDEQRLVDRINMDTFIEDFCQNIFLNNHSADSDLMKIMRDTIQNM